MAEEHRRRTTERASVIGVVNDFTSEIGDDAFGSWALRAAHSEHQMQKKAEDLEQKSTSLDRPINKSTPDPTET
uniref:Uncharacterized protein n=1 Tax=Caenorhabditis japonica TaxID=281687 RepID=A0A8R1IQW2_CAEJA